MQRNQKNRILSLLLSGVVLIGMAIPANLRADDCCYEAPSCCYGSGWGYGWLWGGLLGAAAGAGTGYWAGHDHGKKGRRGKGGDIGPEGPIGPQGPIGPIGPQGPGVEYNLTDPLQVNFENQIFAGTNIVVQAIFSNAVSGTTIINFTIEDMEPDGVVVDLPALQSKLVGDYYLELNIEANPDGTSTPIGSFTLFDGTDLIPFTLVEGFAPTDDRSWIAGEQIILRATFNP